MDAVFAHALAKANAVLDAEAIDHGAASDALSRLIRSSWPILAQHRGLLAAAQRELPPARIRRHHDQAMARVERLIARGQDEGDFRTDLPRPWLVATFYSLMHAAAEEVDAGRLDPAQAGGVLATTILAALAA
jgi:TetR/AcrR family transcriptional regulator, mexCD-oprJ operon repressor